MSILKDIEKEFYNKDLDSDISKPLNLIVDAGR